MIGQLDHKVISSFYLFIDNLVLSRGQAFLNTGFRFYPQTSKYANYYIYTAPFSQLIYDQSISGANYSTGVYLNNVFITTGISGFKGVDYNKGRAIFSTNQNNYVISGAFAVKDFDILLTNKTDEEILFRTKYELKPKYPQTPTGIPDNSTTYPCIWIRDDGGENSPYAIGGQDKANYNFKCIIMADSLYNLYGIQSIFRQSVRKLMPLFESAEQPFNSLGLLESGVYNYTGAAYVKNNEYNYAFIENVRVPRQTQSYQVDSKSLNSNVFFNFVDFELSLVGDFRTC